MLLEMFQKLPLSICAIKQKKKHYCYDFDDLNKKGYLNKRLNKQRSKLLHNLYNLIFIFEK